MPSDPQDPPSRSHGDREVADDLAALREIDSDALREIEAIEPVGDPDDRPPGEAESPLDRGLVAGFASRAEPGGAKSDAPDQPATWADLTGELLSHKYRVVRLLGKGGVGEVYEAKDEMLGASVAVKVLNARAARAPDALERFLGEAKVLTSLDHENIIRWITFDRTDAGLHYFVMEYLRGEELSEVLKREGKLEPERAVDMLLQMLRALNKAHRLDDDTALLHLDLKPQNVFVTSGEPERVKVIDFGMSQHVGAVARAPVEAGASPIDEDQEFDLTMTIATRPSRPASGDETVTRVRGGTLIYASPEQCKHLAGHNDIVALDGRSDLYSLGVIAFEMLTGELPYGLPESPIDAFKKHFEQQPRKVGECGVRVSSRLSAFIDRLLQKRREDRFADAADALDELERIANPPGLWPKVTAVAAVVAAVLVWIVWPEQRLEDFDVLAQAEDGNVYLGPQQQTVSLGLANLGEVDPTTPVRLVRDKAAGDEATALPGWRAALVEPSDGGVKLELTAAPGQTGLLARTVYARISSDPPVDSTKVDVVFLGKGAWDLVDVRIPGLGSRDLDPRDAVLEISLRGNPDYIETVKVGLKGEEAVLVATPDKTRVDAGNANPEDQKTIYTLHLEEFEAIGKATAVRDIALAVTVIDKAAARQEKSLELKVDPRPLSVEATLAGCPVGVADSYVVYPKVHPTLVVSAPRVVSPRIIVRGQDGGVIPFTQETTSEGTRLELEKSKIAYSGEILVTVEDEHRVLHAIPERGEAKARLAFSYMITPPKLTVAPRGLKETPRAEGAPIYFTNGDELVLSLQRNEVQITVEVDCHPAGVGESTTQELRLHQDTGGPLSFALPVEGPYDIAWRAYRYTGAGQERPAEPEDSGKLIVVRDKGAPAVRLVAPSEAIMREPAAVDRLVDVAVEDAVADRDHAAPVTLQWKLTGPVTGQNELPVPGPQRRLTWADLEQDPTKLSDGKYELSLFAEDAAGNKSGDAGKVSHSWEIAQRPPRVSLQSPAAARWIAVEENRFRVVVRATDPNGVGSVTCKVRNIEGGSLDPVTLRPTGDDRTDAEWSGEVELPRSWSLARVEIACRARDAYGNDSSTLREVIVTAFKVTPLAVVEVALRDDPSVDVTPMHLVAGTTGYAFGGRVERFEQETFGRYKLTYRGRSEVKFQEVRDFYLDETEVTVAQYLAFVEADDGYRNVAHWPDAAARPPDVRRRELEQRLGQTAPADLPVTGIDWHEAAAYASWVGKRLPTLLEWEYAVRGGRDAYRPYSCAVEGEEPDKSAFNVDIDMVEGRRAWPVTKGSDVTPAGVGAGIRNLCSNVSEWSADVDDQDRAFDAGASFESLGTVYCFDRVAPRQKNRRAATLGFRCALDAEHIDAMREGGPDLRLRIRPESRGQQNEEQGR